MKRFGKLLDLYATKEGKINKLNFDSSILKAYVEWQSFAVEKIPPPNEMISQLWDTKIANGQDSSADENLNKLLQKAELLLNKCESSIPVSIDMSVLQIGPADVKFDSLGYKKYKGIFYTAMLNVGTKERKLLFYSKNPIPFLGYGLKKGIVEAYAHCLDFMGYKAEGGCTFNYGRNSWCFGTDALDGIFVNQGTLMDYFGQFAKGGTFVNNGSIGGGFGYGADDGLFVNYNQAVNLDSNYFGFGENSRGGVFIDAKEVSMQDYLMHYLGLGNNRFMRHSFGIGIDQFMLDNYLQQMVTEIQKCMNNAFDKQKFLDLSSNIKNYCLEKYR